MYTRKLITQTAANAPAVVQITTNLTVDGRQGWNITGLRWTFTNIAAAITPIATCNAQIQVNTEAGNQAFDDPDSIFLVNTGAHGIAASTSSVYIPATGTQVLPEPRTTVQPIIYIALDSIGMTQALSVGVEITYEIVKLSDIEVMRLLQGGA